MPLIKVWNHDRSVRKIVKVTDLESLLNVGGQKLGYDTEELKAWKQMALTLMMKILFYFEINIVIALL